MTLSLSQASFDQKLVALHSSPYVPERLANFVATIARAQRIAAEDIKIRIPKQEASAEQHAQGMPLVVLAGVAWNKRDAEKLFKQLLAATAVPAGAEQDALAKAGELLAAAVKEGTLGVQDALVASAAQDRSFFVPWAEKLPEAPDLLPFLARNTLLPFFAAVAEGALARTKSPEPWMHGLCPVCGGVPVMGVLLGKEGMRKHTCSACHHTYRVPRLQCPFCLTEKPDGTVVYTAEEDKTYQLHVCDSCKGYMKLADLHDRDGAYVPLVDDVLSLVFDYKAAALGYSRPVSSLPGA
ncbi:formate dehydrogenase accessory protein FdhE [Desulfovibrio cuneatus]|uniref:formate dehydrogenase accessory protein FdhE n=1 Tax=Desulfovibrio cuneatus TaxID=159728 RepID=UPI00040CD218|nr:formate dehydrogenase accessory protein FdhE [Desulfovibrio cuneatus]